MKNILTLIFTLQAIISFGQNSKLIDVVTEEQLNFKLGSIYEPSRLNKTQFINFELLDSTLDSNKEIAIRSYFQDFLVSDTASIILRTYDNKVMDLLNQEERTENIIKLSRILLAPISYLNDEIYFQHTIEFKTSEGYRQQKFVKMFYSYNVKTGHINDLNNVKRQMNPKTLFKALQSKWDNQMSFINIKGHKSLFKNYDIETNTSESYNVLNEKVTDILQSKDLNALDIYWTGAGLMVRLKEAFVSKKKEQLIPIQIHLDINELPNDCLKLFNIPKSIVNRIKQTPIQNFNSWSNMPSQTHFELNKLELTTVRNKNIKQLDISYNKPSTSKLIIEGNYFYNKGKLIKRVQFPNNKNGTIDSVLWVNESYRGYISRYINYNSKNKSCFIEYDKNNNRLAYYTIKKNIDLERCVYLKDRIIVFPYSIFETNFKDHLFVSYYQRNTNGWIYYDAINKTHQPYILKNNKPSVIGEQTYVYNKHGNIVQYWKENHEFTLYNYGKDNHLNEVINRNSGKYTEYKYKYSDLSLVKEVDVYKVNKTKKELQTYYYKWIK